MQYIGQFVPDSPLAMIIGKYRYRERHVETPFTRVFDGCKCPPSGSDPSCSPEALLLWRHALQRADKKHKGKVVSMGGELLLEKNDASKRFRDDTFFRQVPVAPPPLHNPCACHHRQPG